MSTAKIECPRCDGKGVLPQYYYNRKGICFRCWGKKYVTVNIPEGKSKDEVIAELKKREAEDLASEKNKPKTDMVDAKNHKNKDYWKGANSKVDIPDKPKRNIDEVMKEINAELQGREKKLDDETDIGYIKSIIQRLQEATEHPNKQKVIDRLSKQIETLEKKEAIREQMKDLTLKQLEQILSKLEEKENPTDLEKMMMNVANEVEGKKWQELQNVITDYMKEGDKKPYNHSSEDWGKLIKILKDKFGESDYVDKQIRRVERWEKNALTDAEIQKHMEFDAVRNKEREKQAKQQQDYIDYMNWLKQYMMDNLKETDSIKDEPAISMYHGWLDNLDQLKETLDKAREMMEADNPKLTSLEGSITRSEQIIQQTMERNAKKEAKLKRLSNKRFKNTETAREVQKQMEKGFTTVKDVVAVGKIAGRGIVEGYIAKAKPLYDAKENNYAEYKAVQEQISNKRYFKDQYLKRYSQGQQATEKIAELGADGFPFDNKYGWKSVQDIFDDMENSRNKSKEISNEIREMNDEATRLWEAYQDAKKKYDELADLHDDEGKIIKSVVLDELTKVREFGGGSATFDKEVLHREGKDRYSKEEKQKQLDDMIDDVRRFFPTSWLNEAESIKVVRTEDVKDGRSYYSYNYIAMAEVNYSTMIHEYTHHMQSKITGLFEKEMEFIRDRTGLRQQKRVNTACEVHERYWIPKKNKPEWIHNYMGKTYHDTGKEWKKFTKDNINTTEFMTMGMEELMGNPLKLYEHDEELFYYLIGVLAGV